MDMDRTERLFLSCHLRIVHDSRMDGADTHLRDLRLRILLRGEHGRTGGLALKTLVIVSGQMRTFSKLWKNQYWQVYRKLMTPTFVVSVADDEQGRDAQKFHDFGPTHIDLVQQPDHIDLPEECPDELAYEKLCHEYALQGRDQPSFMHEPYSISVSPQAVMKQLWALKNAWDFAASVVKLGDFEIVVRMRPDLHFFHFANPEYFRCNEAYTPFWGKFGGVNDRMAVLGAGVAGSYFDTFSLVPYLVSKGAPLHPETLIHESLKRGDADFRPLDTLFATARMDGTMRFPEIAPHEHI